MAPDVTVKAIEFKEHGSNTGVAFVQFLLSNGDKSPIFKTASADPQGQKTINLDSVNRPVRAISASDSKDVYVFNLKF